MDRNEPGVVCWEHQRGGSVVGTGVLGGPSSSSLGVEGVGQLGWNEGGVVGGEQQRVDVAVMLGEGPSAYVLPAADPLHHVKNTEKR